MYFQNTISEKLYIKSQDLKTDLGRFRKYELYINLGNNR